MKLASPSQGFLATSGVGSSSFPLLGGNGTEGAPTYSFSGSSSTGMFRATAGLSAHQLVFSVAGTGSLVLLTSSLAVPSTHTIGWLDNTFASATDLDVKLVRDAANTLALKNSTTTQTFRVYGTTTGPCYLQLVCDNSTGDVYIRHAGSLRLGSNNSVQWQINSSGHLLAVTDNSYDIGASDATRPRALFLSAPSVTKGNSGTGITLVDSGSVRQVVYKITTTYQAFAAAATTGDYTICTLPAKSRVVAVYADTTTKYIGGAVTAATLRLGISAGGVEFIASHDVFTAAVTKGIADADMGTNMTRAAQIQGGYLNNWSGTTTAVARITTTTANTNALTQGSTTWYIVTEVLP